MNRIWLVNRPWSIESRGISLQNITEVGTALVLSCQPQPVYPFKQSLQGIKRRLDPPHLILLWEGLGNAWIQIFYLQVKCSSEGFGWTKTFELEFSTDSYLQIMVWYFYKSSPKKPAVGCNWQQSASVKFIYGPVVQLAADSGLKIRTVWIRVPPGLPNLMTLCALLLSV